MKRTDDFLTDLEAQLGAAAAGRLRPRRRLRASRLLRPALVAAAAATAIFAFVLAAGTDPDPERAAQPPASSGTFELRMAPAGYCAADPGDAEVPNLSVLRHKGGAVRTDAPATVIAMDDVGSCSLDGTAGRGACVVVDLAGTRHACWAMSEIEAGRAVAALGEGFVIAVLPDRFRSVTFRIAGESDTYTVTDNVVIGHLEGARKGAQIEIVPGSAPVAGCLEGQMLDSPLPDALTFAVPALAGGEPRDVPDHVLDLLAKAGANRIWPGEGRWLLVDEDVAVWVVPVADSRFAECDLQTAVFAPQAFEGPGACLVATHRARPAGALCTDLDDLGGVSAHSVGERRLALAFLPHGATALEAVGATIAELRPSSGVAAGFLPAGASLEPVYSGPEGPVAPTDVTTNPVAVLAPTGAAAQEVTDRLARAGLEVAPTGAHPVVDRSRVMYGAGMAASARQVAELLRIQDVLPLDPQTAQRADAKAAVVVVAGEDLRP